MMSMSILRLTATSLGTCAVAGLASLGLVGCTHPGPLPTAHVVVDGTASSSEARSAIRQRAADFVDEAVTSGSYAAITFTRIGGVPGDLITSTTEIDCDDTDRVCQDPARVERVTTEALTTLDSVLEASPTIAGSAPISATWNVLSGANPGDKTLILSDFTEHSDLVDLTSAVDLSTPDARRALIERISSAGIDFSSTKLPSGHVTVELVPAEAAAESAVRFEQLRAFVTELLIGTKSLIFSIDVLDLTYPTTN